MSGKGATLELRRQAALVAYRAFSDAAGKGAQLLITLVAARRLTTDAFGLFALGSTLGWLAAVASDFGIQLHVARAVSIGTRDAPSVLQAWLRVRVWSSSVAAGLLGCWLLIARPPSALIVLLLAAVYLVNGLVEFLHYFYRGLSRSDIESTLTLWQRLSTLATAVVVLWWTPQVAALALGLLVMASATLLYSLRKAQTLAAETVSIASSKVDRAILTKEFVRDVLPIGAGIFLSALYFRVDVFLIELWRGASAVGLYNAVFRLVEALRLFPAAVLAVVLPQLCRASAPGPLVRVATVVTLFGLATTTVLWLAAGQLIPLLYGARYTEAVPVFRTLLLAFPLMSLNYALTHQLVAWHHHGFYAMIAAVALIFNVALNVNLIPAFGIMAAAWTTVGTEGVVTLLCLGTLAYVSSRPSLLSRVRSIEGREALETVENLLVM